MAKIWNFMRGSGSKAKKDKKPDKKKKHAIDPDDNMVEEMISKTKKK